MPAAVDGTQKVGAVIFGALRRPSVAPQLTHLGSIGIPSAPRMQRIVMSGQSWISLYRVAEQSRIAGRLLQIADIAVSGVLCPV
jgi:hypothetical protein